jgi:hypothetical protein
VAPPPRDIFEVGIDLGTPIIAGSFRPSAFEDKYRPSDEPLA